ncbi:hypothetical protein E2C01_095504 [Portunus trituberculatus]|uniref:Uncharacterized protein n=1 Tax=Portunus trituberculatus TaxID=210409 RepID=A0A5B7JZJ9_PORTR|nr:hypothetical protein [Portunus trituberculatus]
MPFPNSLRPLSSSGRRDSTSGSTHVEDTAIKPASHQVTRHSSSCSLASGPSSPTHYSSSSSTSWVPLNPARQQQQLQQQAPPPSSSTSQQASPHPSPPPARPAKVRGVMSSCLRFMVRSEHNKMCFFCVCMELGID